jgi:hypothetical protein
MSSAAPSPSAPGSALRLPSYPWRFVHLAALWGFGVSQPVFSMLKGNPEFLVVRGSTRADVVVFALLLAFALPLLVVVAEAVIGLVWAMLSRALHIAAVWCFGFLAVLQLVRMTQPDQAVTLLLPMLPAALIALAYMRWSAFRSGLSFCVALPVLGIIAFAATVPLAVDDAEGADVSVGTSTPVVLVVLDELPTSSLLRADGTLDARRYPNFARLARDGVWYPRATTVHEFTTQAVPAILTGNTPKQDELPTLRDHPRNLFTLLGERYAAEVVEPVTRLCPARYCPEAHVEAVWTDRYRGLFYDVGVAYLYRVLPASLRVELPPIGDRWGGFGGGTRERLLGALDTHDVNIALDSEDHRPRSEFRRFLAGIRPGEPRRTLHFLHVKLPHAPFRLLPSGREYGNAISVDGILTDAFNDWAGSQVLVNQAQQRYLLQLGYTDRLLGVLLDRLRETGGYDRALVIVTADHGASFLAGGDRRFVDNTNVADIAGVPLFVKYPGPREGRTDVRDARTTDILPTIAEVLGIDLPWPVDGRSLLGQPVARPVSVGRRYGPTLVVDADAVRAGVLETARRNAAIFGEGRDSLYRIGPYPVLLGRAVDRVVPTATVSAHLDAEAQFADVRPSSGFVPTRVVGTVDGAPRSGRALAIAVNGEIAATTETYVQGEATRFAAMVPESSFRRGRNDVEVFGIASTGGVQTLARLGGTGRGATYALSPDSRSLVLPSGRRVTLAKGRLAGGIESSTVEGAAVRIQGWAADVRNVARVDRVLIFAGHRLLFSSDTPAYRFDIDGVSRIRGLQHVGFVAELPLRDVRGARLRAIAVRGTLASELDWPRTTSELAAVSGP